MYSKRKGKKGGMTKKESTRKDSDKNPEVDIEEKEDWETFKMLNEIFKDPILYGLEEDQVYLYNIVSTRFVDKWEDYIKGKAKNAPDLEVNDDLLDKFFYSTNDIIYKYDNENYSHLNVGIDTNLKLNRDFILCSHDAWIIIEKKFKCIPIVRKFDLYNGKFSYINNLEYIQFVMIDNIKTFDIETVHRYIVQWDENDLFSEVVDRLKIDYYNDNECLDSYSYDRFDSRQDFDMHHMDELITLQRKEVDKITEVYMSIRGFRIQNDYLDGGFYNFPLYDLLRNQATVIMVRKAKHDEDPELHAKFFMELLQEPILEEIKELCEYCKRSRVILIPCNCNFVYYCSLKCRVKDINFHDKVCSVSKNVIHLLDHEYVQNSLNDNLSLEYNPSTRVGLYNLENTCYMSSILQILMRMPDFMNYLLQKDFSDMLTYKKESPSARLLPYFSHTYKKMFGDCAKKAYSPWIVKAAVGVANNTFSKFNQNDVHEFFTYILDEIGNEMSSRGDQKILHDLLRGQYEVSKRCQSCQVITKRNEEFLFINMPIPQLGEKVKVWVKFVHKESPYISVYETEIKKIENLHVLNKQVEDHFGISKKNFFQCISDGSCISEILHEFDMTIKELTIKIEEKRNTNLFIWAFEVTDFWSYWNDKKAKLEGKKLVCYSILKKIKSINNYINQKIPTGLLMVDFIDSSDSFLDVYKIAYKKMLATDFQPESIITDNKKYTEASQSLKTSFENYINKKIDTFENKERKIFDEKVRQEMESDTRSKFNDLNNWTDDETGFLRYHELEDDQIEDDFQELIKKLSKNCEEIHGTPFIDYNDLFISQLFFKSIDAKSFDLLNVQKYAKMIDNCGDKDILELKKDFDNFKLKLYNKDLINEISNYATNFSNMEASISYSNKTPQACAMCKKGSCRSCTFIPNNRVKLSEAVYDDFVNLSVSFNLEINKILERYLNEWSHTYETSVKHENSITKKRIVTLQSCFEKMTDEEDMDEDCLVDCDSCVNKTRTSQKTSFSSLGSLLIIVLKRFRTEFNIIDDETIKLKNNILVEFEDHVKINETTYKLFGVIDHIGKELDKGHYVANVQMNDNEWIVFDDDEIKNKEFKNVVSEKAYMLFYQKEE